MKTILILTLIPIICSLLVLLLRSKYIMDKKENIENILRDELNKPCK